MASTSTSTHLAIAARLRLALEMFDDGVAMKRLALHRQHPDEDEAQRRRRIVGWLRDHPGHGGHRAEPPPSP